MPTETIQLMRQHRSIRKFTEQAIEPAQLTAIMAAAQPAATSSFQQCVTVIQVNDIDKRKHLASLCHDQEYVASAANFLVFCADYHRQEQIVPEADFGYVEQLLTAAIDAGLAAQNALLAAQSLGLGGVYIGALRNHPKEVIALLELPKHVFPLFGLCLGHPAQDPPLKPRLPLSFFWHHDIYQPFVVQDVQVYDQQIAEYYQKRSNQTNSWTQTVLKKFLKESRPFMLECLQQQGFAER